MTWAELCDWAWRTLHIRLVNNGATWHALWGGEGRGRKHIAYGSGTGSGNPAVYTVGHRRRLQMWVQVREWVYQRGHKEWLALSELHGDGWLVDDGTGVRWVAEPVDEWKELLQRGFLAFPCHDKP